MKDEMGSAGLDALAWRLPLLPGLDRRIFEQALIGTSTELLPDSRHDRMATKRMTTQLKIISDATSSTLSRVRQMAARRSWVCVSVQRSDAHDQEH